jgi:SAM-dependent methyltransferase
VILALARHAEEAVGVDAEPDMLAQARAAGFRLGLRNVTWMRARAEDLADADFRAKVGQFRLVTMGMSFHWMDRERVLAGVYAALLPGGGLAIIGQDVANTSLRGIIDETLMKFLGEPPHPHADRPVQTERHEAVVARTPLTGFETVTIPYKRVWNVDQIIGWVYSFSDGAYFRLGDRRPEFERMLRDRLFPLDSTGVFSENVSAEIILAWKT